MGSRDKGAKSNRKKRIRVVGKAAAAMNPSLLFLATQGPEDGLFLERRSEERQKADQRDSPS